ncbi:MAG: leucine-rich repeat domain-containing protein, partial [Muribaculaceae bacterium]|nr:leucine-rich repeat domain-containing protein [Muribaculaceae bacterium]
YDLGFTVKTITDLYIGRDWYVDDAKNFSLFPNVETLILGKYVKNIPSYAFFKAKLNEELILPETLVSIGENAFFDTQISGDLIIPSSVMSLSSDSFAGCGNIKRCICPERFRFQMDRLGYMIFYPDYNSQFNEDGCLYSSDKTKLYYVPLKFYGEYELPSSVNSIGDYAFAYCDQVTSVKLPSSLKGLGTACFEGCSHLSGELDIPEGVEILNPNTFKDCKKIAKINLHDNIRNIQSEVFSGCSSLESITLPKSITKIYPGLFNGCSSLDNLNIPENVNIIGNSAFRGCANLKEMILPEGVTNIPQSCFQDCASLNKVTLKGAVSEIGLSAFQGCNDLKDFVISKSSLPSLEGDSFSEINYRNTLLTIPENMFIDYISSSWSAFINLRVGEKMSVLFSDGIFDYREFPGDDANRAVLIKGNYSGLHSANIPDRFTDDNKTRHYITMIAPEAFKGCTNLNSLTFSDRSQLESIGEGAFSGCTGLKSVVLPSSLVTISNEVFKGCSSIESVSMKSNVTEIGEGVFEGCVNLTEIELSENLTSISQNLFYGCVALESIELPEGVTTIDAGAFYHTGLKSVVIPGTVDNIRPTAFAECGEMTDLELAES